MRHYESRSRMMLIVLLVAIPTIMVALLIHSIVTAGRPLTRDQAEREAYGHLEGYCRKYHLDVSLFDTPLVVRGKLPRYNLKTHMDDYGPTWEFYYRYMGTPSITVYYLYDEVGGGTELMYVFQPGERWPLEYPGQRPEELGPSYSAGTRMTTNWSPSPIEVPAGDSLRQPELWRRKPK